MVEAAIGIDTDQFGSFSRETDRSGSQLDAARAKIMAGFEKLPRARVGLASEGSFRPHPDIPFLGIGSELILMVDRKKGIELAAYNAGPQTNFAHAVVQDVDAAFAFGQRAGFPEHGLIVMACHKISPSPHTMLDKNVTDAASLETAVKKALNLCGSAFVETDMRANRNPTRMAAIGRATADLVRRFHSRCPRCSHRGFDVTDRLAGLPCACCGQPTDVI